MRKAMKNTIFGAALVAGLLAAGTAANAQRPGFYGRGFERPIVRERVYRPVGPEFGFGVTVGAPVVDTYVPPCPGDGYEWVAGYYDGGYWVPGAWRLRAGYVARPYGGFGYERHFDRDDRHFDRDDRHFDRDDRHFDRDRGFYGRR